MNQKKKNLHRLVTVIPPLKKVVDTYLDLKTVHNYFVTD